MIPNETNASNMLLSQLTHLMVHVIGMPIHFWEDEEYSYPIREALTDYCSLNDIDSIHELFHSLDENALLELHATNGGHDGSPNEQGKKKLDEKERSIIRDICNFYHFHTCESGSSEILRKNLWDFKCFYDDERLHFTKIINDPMEMKQFKLNLQYNDEDPLEEEGIPAILTEFDHVMINFMGISKKAWMSTDIPHPLRLALKEQGVTNFKEHFPFLTDDDINSLKVPELKNVNGQTVYPERKITIMEAKKLKAICSMFHYFSQLNQENVSVKLFGKIDFERYLIYTFDPTIPIPHWNASPVIHSKNIPRQKIFPSIGFANFKELTDNLQWKDVKEQWYTTIHVAGLGHCIGQGNMPGNPVTYRKQLFHLYDCLRAAAQTHQSAMIMEKYRFSVDMEAMWKELDSTLTYLALGKYQDASTGEMKSHFHDWMYDLYHECEGLALRSIEFNIKHIGTPEAEDFVDEITKIQFAKDTFLTASGKFVRIDKHTGLAYSPAAKFLKTLNLPKDVLIDPNGKVYIHHDNRLVQGIECPYASKTTSALESISTTDMNKLLDDTHIPIGHYLTGDGTIITFSGGTPFSPYAELFSRYSIPSEIIISSNGSQHIITKAGNPMRIIAFEITESQAHDVDKDPFLRKFATKSPQGKFYLHSLFPMEPGEHKGQICPHWRCFGKEGKEVMTDF